MAPAGVARWEVLGGEGKGYKGENYEPCVMDMDWYPENFAQPYGTNQSLPPSWIFSTNFTIKLQELPGVFIASAHPKPGVQ